ncbi:MAG TPA: cation:proton antiporter [Candidatus Hydrogenedentes bacterium]|nr:cation:proton antiporter [Candidatus Hydrogenedentota bacterium]
MELLDEIVIVFGLAIVVAWLFRSIQVPSIIGFLITGLAIGPSGWHWVSQSDVSHFSEFGLILLLFTIGLELSPEPLIRSGIRLISGAIMQILGTALLTIVVLSLFPSLPWAARFILGVAVALSSTAITLKLMSDRGETLSTTGMIATGILLLQDVAVIILMLIISIVFGGNAENGHGGGILLGIEGLAGLFVIVLVSRPLLPKILEQLSGRGGRELLTLFAVLMTCGGAWLATLVGWSPALGACISGLLLANADQRHQLVADITPFRDVFNALFFISLGMTVNLDAAFRHFPVIVGATALTIVIKTLVTAGSIRGAGWPWRIGLQTGIALCSVSEFSYVLAYQARHNGLLEASTMDLLVGYVVATMIVGALVYPYGNRIAAWITARIHEKKPADGDEIQTVTLRDHVVIVGYGFTGSNLGRMLRATHVPYCVVEMNPALVQAARKDGAEVIVGDATRMTILAHAGIDAARALVVAVNDHRATQRIVGQVNARRPDLYILARTNFARDIERLYQLGAKRVIPQDFETSIEVGAHVLRQFGIPDNIVEAQIAAVRSGGYGMLRGKPTNRAATEELMKILERTTTQTFYLADDSAASGKTIAETNLRARTGCTIIAVVRAGRPATNPAPDFLLKSNDVLVLVGAHAEIEAAKAVLQRG